MSEKGQVCESLEKELEEEKRAGTKVLESGKAGRPGDVPGAGCGGGGAEVRAWAEQTGGDPVHAVRQGIRTCARVWSSGTFSPQSERRTRVNTFVGLTG